jgi:thiol-disulfide isomerase/thioredoxin
MGKASRTKVESTRREKIAAQRAAERRAEKRRRILLASGAVVVVLAIALTFVIVKLNSKPSSSASSASNGPTGSALTAVVNKVTSVPARTLDAVGDGGGSVTGKPTPISGAALTANGKPEMLYVGAEYCPYCAAERWAMIVALSRFGTFSGLSTIHSSSTDAYPNTPTFTFYGSTYRSKYVSFVPVETTTNYRVGNSASPSVPYVTLPVPSAAEQALIDKYDPGTDGNPIPFIDVGGKYVQISNLAPDGPQELAGMTWAQIASALRDPSSAVAQGVEGSANYLTAEICMVTGNQPASACTAAVRALEPRL